MTIHIATDVKVYIGGKEIRGFISEDDPLYRGELNLEDNFSSVSDAIQHQRKKEKEYADKQKEKVKDNKIDVNKTTVHSDLPDHVFNNLTKTSKL